MKSSDQADSGGDWRMQLQDMRTLSALRAGAPPPDEVERLSDRVLRAAAINPDHSEEARAAATEALAARRLSPEPWRVRVPSFLSAPDLKRFVVSALGRRPARVCVLRPTLAVARAPLRGAIAREFRPYGHVVTLTAGVEGVVVKSAADYRARALELGNRFALNLINMSTRRETLSLSASEHWRPLVLKLLLDSSDALVVDLSDGGSWALDAIMAEGAAERCVFVALWGKLEDAEAALGAAGLPHQCFAYAPDGEIQRRPQFRAAMLEAMRVTHGAPHD